VSLSYKDAGVDIAAQDELVERIKPLAKSTRRIGTDAALGGFGCLFDVSKTHFKDPILVSKTDGVGTKLKLAQQMGVHHTVGIDLVAMSVNDVLCQGAEPLFFLDYFACASLNIDEGYQVVKGIADGCLQSGCSLIGGETAEMPGMYQPGEYDLAGFAVGAVEREQMLPKLDLVVPGDIVLGLSSSGIHSNGYSLVRKIISVNKIDLHQPPPFSSKHQRIGDVLLEPTKIYVKPVLPLIQDQTIKALAHITGGGLPENIPRVVPSNVQVDLDLRSWPLPPIYKWLISLGKFSADDLLKTWNMGIGLVIVVAADKLEHVRKVLKEHGEESYIIGHVSARQPSDYKGEDAPVFVHNSEALFE
jgi:phosphoribosylamine--glycine ligase/phosphoribosylformylglycinamidine cyclo-ligase